MEWANTPEYSTMYHDLPRSARFWLFLLAVDQDLAETIRQQGCSAHVGQMVADLTPRIAHRNDEVARLTL